MSGVNIWITDKLKGIQIPPNVVLVDEELSPSLEWQIEKTGMVAIDNKKYNFPPPHLEPLMEQISERAMGIKIWDVVIKQRAFRMESAIVRRIKINEPRRGIVFPDRADILNFCNGLGISENNINFEQ